MSKRFEQSIIMITGASSGIGRAVAEACGREGANVIALGRDEDALAEVQQNIEGSGGRCLCIPFDLYRFDDYGRLFLALKDQIPHLDGLVHCAGEINRCTPLQYVKAEDFRRMLDIHLAAPNLLTQSMLPLLRRAEAASVIFTTCDMIDRDLPNWHGYGLAKRALGYAAAMWQFEQKDKEIRFNTLNPGKVRTELFRRTYGGMHPKEVPPPEDIAEAYLYLLSDASRNHRGCTLHARDILEAGKGD